VWNALEVAKLVVSVLTPVLVVSVGLFINKRLKKIEYNQWRNQKLIEKRLTIYDDLAPLLNDILCYYTYVGNWKENSPIQIINLKRIVDKKVYLAAPLFCKEFLSSCMNFMNLCYETYTGWGQEPKLRTSFQKRQEVFGVNWEKNWDQIFSNSNHADPKGIQEAYINIMHIFSEEIGLQNNNQLHR
jgi:hypothetical protein